MSNPNPNPQYPNLTVDPSTTDDFFKAVDYNDDRFHITARFNDYSDSVVLTIVTKILSSGEKSTIPAEAFFDAMMDHFQSTGGHPGTIRGIWDADDPELRTNLDRFNKYVLGGDDEETAAWKTFTGRMAKKYNYTKITFGTKEPAGATPGHYTLVHVYFKE